MAMLFNFFSAQTLGLIFGVVSLFVATLLAIFLFWRAGRHELYNSDFLFDLTLAGSLGGLIFGRVFSFFVDFSYFNFDPFKLIFFHRYPGFNFLGFVFGFMLFAYLYLKKTKEKYWMVADLLAAPFVFAFFSFFGLSIIFNYLILNKLELLELVFTVYFLFVFITLKRLSAKKRQPGFFAGLFFVFLGSYYISKLALLGKELFFTPRSGIVFVLSLIFILCGFLVLHIGSKHKFSLYLKNIMAVFLLLALNFKRGITCVDEAGRIARNVILLPYFIFRSFLVLLVMLFKETSKAFGDFIYVLGFKKYKL